MANSAEQSITPPAPRERKPIKEVFSPYDISRPLLDQGFLGGEDQADLARLEVVGGAEPPSTFFNLIIKCKETLIADGFTEVEFHGTKWRLEELTTVEEMKARMAREQAESTALARKQREEIQKEFILGTATQVEDAILQNLASSVPEGARLVINQKSNSETIGFGTGKHSQFRGELTVKLVSEDGKEKVLAIYYSPWTNINPASHAQHPVDQHEDYSYILNKQETIANLRDSIK